MSDDDFFEAMDEAGATQPPPILGLEPRAEAAGPSEPSAPSPATPALEGPGWVPAQPRVPSGLPERLAGAVVDLVA